MSLYQEGFTQNREISWLKYNERVLEEALDKTVPLFERLKYIAIFESNLEEFFQVRVGSLIEEKKDGDNNVDEKSGLTANEQLVIINLKTKDLLKKKDKALKQVETELAEAGLVRCNFNELSGEEERRVERFFVEKIKKELNPSVLNSWDDIFYVDEYKLYIIAKFKSEQGNQYGIVDIPNNIPKIFIIDNALIDGGKIRYILVEDIIKEYINKLFFPYEATEVHSMDISRNAEVSGDNSLDPLSNMKEIVKKRKHAEPDKIIFDGKLSLDMRAFFLSNLDLSDKQMYFTDRISLAYVKELEKNIPAAFIKEFCFPAHKPFDQLQLGRGSIIERAYREDILSYYPYDSMKPFLELLRESSVSPNVEEIRITIYRLSSQPQIINYLIDAARNGKKVNVLIELRARFDEENNIDWAEKLIESGCNVFYGSNKYKVHSKLCQIVFKNESGKKKFITQLSTGNYNEKTVSVYTDFSLITYNQEIGKSVELFWKDIIDKEYGKYDEILTSPKNLEKSLLKLIKREEEKGRDGKIFFKVNSLSDEKIIEALMNASCAGCQINLIVRGICCLLPGVEFCTENIKIVNLVGRFLEHSRVYMFGSGEDELIYISSADLMTRNLQKRVELACPIYSKKLKNRIKAIMYLTFNDNVKGRIIDKKGNYRHKKCSGHEIDSQSMLMSTSF